MTFVRIFVLLLVLLVSWSMGQSPPSQLNAFGKFVAALFFVAVPALYFLPTFEAAKRNHPSLMSIGLVNVFLGWTLIGWVTAIAWACANEKRSADAQEEAPATRTVENAERESLASPDPSDGDYEAAMREFESEARHPGLWARLFAEAAGDEAAAKAKYVSIRAQQKAASPTPPTQATPPQR